MPVTIRNATAREIPLLVEMMGEFYAESGYALDETWAKAAFAALLGDESYGAAWIVGRDGEPAGYVVLTLRFSMEQGGLEGCIDDLFVRPDARRRGLGRILLETLLAECK